MNRWLWIGSLACLLIASTGCRSGCGIGGCKSGGCKSGGGGAATCTTGGCSTGECGQTYGDCGACGGGGCSSCSQGQAGKAGLCAKSWGGECRGCAGCRTGCRAGHLGWQQGGLDYSSHLNPGLLGHKAGKALNNRPFTPGPPSAQVGYPYYSHRGPRDFLLDNPPTIGQ